MFPRHEAISPELARPNRTAAAKYEDSTVVVLGQPWELALKRAG
jgi:hypothetical protein